MLKTNTGMEYWASVDDLFIRGQESDTIINQTEDGKISSSVKINNPIINKSVDLKYYCNCSLLLCPLYRKHSNCKLPLLA